MRHYALPRAPKAFQPADYQGCITLRQAVGSHASQYLCLNPGPGTVWAAAHTAPGPKLSHKILPATLQRPITPTATKVANTKHAANIIVYNIKSNLKKSYQRLCSFPAAGSA